MNRSLSESPAEDAGKASEGFEIEAEGKAGATGPADFAALGHDRIADFNGIARALPVTVLAFALSGLALIGLPPSGAYLAKELLLGAAIHTGQWWWAIVLQTGGILTSSYVVLALGHALASAVRPITPVAPVSRLSEGVVLALALCFLLLGLVSWDSFLPILRATPFGVGVSMLKLETLATALWLLVGGTVLAALLACRGFPARSERVLAILGAARRASLPLAKLVEQVDAGMRQWPAASLLLLVVAILLGAALMASSP